MKRFSLFLLASLTVAFTVPDFAQANQPRRKQRHRGEKVFKKLDKNNDHQISHAEWTRKPKAFDRIDQNYDGVLSAEEIKDRPKHRRRP